MTISFSQRPGRHERHYRRKLHNRLFADAPAAVDDDALLEAQRLDHEELLAFLGELRATVQRAVDLEPNADSQVVLELKERLDRLYETSAGLAEDHSANQAVHRIFFKPFGQLRQPFNGRIKGVQPSPYNECPGCAVPKP